MIIPYIGFGLQSGMPGFSPASLFSTGEQGAWYDPSNFVSNWRKNLLTYSEQFDNAAWSKQANAYVQTNLLTYSEQFDNAAWTASASNASVTANTTTAPDGTLTADTVTFTTGAGYLYQALSSFSAVSGQSVTFSIYSKTSTQIIIFGGASPAGTDVFSFTNVGNGWYRQTLTRTFSATATATLQLLPSASVTGAGSFYIWGAQLVRGSDAGNYQVTTSAAAATQYPAPDGTNTANLAVFTSTSNNGVYQGSTTYAYETRTASMYLKGTAGQTVSVSWQAPGGNTFTTWTLTGGWDRVTATATNGSAAGNGNIAVQPLSGQTATSVYIWGAQLEVGSTATAYQQIVTPAISYLNYQALPVMYQDAAGTTPVTAVEQPVGLLLDQRQGPTLGSELMPNNGTFSSATGWSAGAGTTIANGVATATASVAGTIIVADNTAPGTIGVWYTVTITVTSLTAGQIRPVLFGNALTSNVITAAGTYSFKVNASAASCYIQAYSSATTATISAFSAKAVSGNHATASGTARPTLSAKYNVLQYTQDFANSYWTKRGTCTVTANSTTAPDGTLTASKIEGIDTGSNDFYNSDFNTVTIAPGGTSLTPSIYIKRISTSGTFIITNATDQAQGQWTINMALLPDGWVRITSTTTGVTVINAFIANNTTLPGKCGLLIRASSGGPISAYFWGADLRVTNDGVNLPNYQRVNASTDYATAGFPLYLLFSGAQGMSTPASIPFATDQMTIWTGERKLSDATVGIVSELSVNVNLNNGSFYIIDPPSAGVTTFTILAKGTSNSSVTAGASAAPVTRVVTAIDSISGSTLTARLNGTQVGTSSATQGTGNFGTYPLFIGARNISNLCFNGRIYSLIVRGVASNASQISSTEGWVNSKTAAY